MDSSYHILKEWENVLSKKAANRRILTILVIEANKTKPYIQRHTPREFVKRIETIIQWTSMDVDLKKRMDEEDVDDIYSPSSRQGNLGSSLGDQLPEFSSADELRVKDLRLLDFSMHPTSPLAILIRRHVVICALDIIRVVIMFDRMFLVLPPGSEFHEEDGSIRVLGGNLGSYRNSLKSMVRVGSEMLFQNESSGEDYATPLTSHIGLLALLARTMTEYAQKDDLESSQQAFEQQCYDAVLSTAVSYFNGLAEQLASDVVTVCKSYDLTSVVLLESQQRTLQLRSQVLKLSAQLRQFKEALEDFMKDVDDLACMSLSVLKRHPEYYSTPSNPAFLCHHEEIEESFENYLIDFCSLEQKLEFLQHRIQSAEARAVYQLNTVEYKALAATVLLQLGNATMLVGHYVSGLFGTNLDQVYAWVRPDTELNFFALFSVLSAVVMIGLFGWVYWWLSQRGVFVDW